MWEKLIEVVHYKCHLYIHTYIYIYIYIERERERERWRQSSMYLYYMYTICIYTICIYTIWDIYYKELAHSVMEAEMSQNLPNASQRSRRADDVITVRARIRRANGETPIQGQQETSVPIQQAGRTKRPEFFLSLSFVLFGLLMHWMISTHTGEGNLLYGAHQFKC